MYLENTEFMFNLILSVYNNTIFNIPNYSTCVLVYYKSYLNNIYVPIK